MRQRRVLPRIWALLLTLSLGLPTPAHALRPLQSSQNTGLEEEITRALRPEQSLNEAPAQAAGLEEPDPPHRPPDFHAADFAAIPIGGWMSHRLRPEDPIYKDVTYEEPGGWKIPFEQVRPGVMIRVRRIQRVVVPLRALRRFATANLAFDIVPMGTDQIIQPPSEDSGGGVAVAPVAKRYLLRTWLGKDENLDRAHLDDGSPITIGREDLPLELDPLTQFDMEQEWPRKVIDSRYRNIFGGWRTKSPQDPEWRIAVSWDENELHRTLFLPRQALSNAVSRGEARGTPRPGWNVSNRQFLPRYLQTGHVQVEIMGEEVAIHDLGSTNPTSVLVDRRWAEDNGYGIHPSHVSLAKDLWDQTDGSFREAARKPLSEGSDERMSERSFPSDSSVVERAAADLAARLKTRLIVLQRLTDDGAFINPERAAQFPFDRPFQVFFRIDGKHQVITDFVVREGQLHARRAGQDWKPVGFDYVVEDWIPAPGQSHLQGGSMVGEGYRVLYVPSTNTVLILNHSPYQLRIAPLAGLEELPEEVRALVDQLLGQGRDASERLKARHRLVELVARAPLTEEQQGRLADALNEVVLRDSENLVLRQETAMLLGNLGHRNALEAFERVLSDANGPRDLRAYVLHALSGLRLQTAQDLRRVLRLLDGILRGEKPESELARQAARAREEVEPLFQWAERLWDTTLDLSSRQEALSNLSQQSGSPSQWREGATQRDVYNWILERAAQSETDPDQIVDLLNPLVGQLVTLSGEPGSREIFDAKWESLHTLFEQVAEHFPSPSPDRFSALRDVLGALKLSVVSSWEKENFYANAVARLGLEVAAAQQMGGGRRGRQEDFYALGQPVKVTESRRGGKEVGFVAVVGDGVGSDPKGNVASRLATTGIARRLTEPSMLVDQEGRRLFQETIERGVSNTIQEVDKEMAAFQSGTTTVAALVLAGDTAFFSHVGDSRIYLDRDGRLILLTEDQNEAWERARREVRREYARPVEPLDLLEIARAAQGRLGRNALTQWVGSGRADVRVTAVPIQRGDRFLLATDGLTEVVPEETLSSTLGNRTLSAADAVRFLMDAAKDAKGDDNQTAIVVDVAGEVPLAPAAGMEEFQGLLDRRERIDGALYGRLFQDVDILYFGEDHLTGELRRELIRAFPMLKRLGVTHLFLEALQSTDQRILDAYLAEREPGRIRPLEAELRTHSLARARRSFSEDLSGSYMELIRAAKKEGIRVVAIDVDTSEMGTSDALQVSNQHMAEEIAREMRTPGAGKGVALMGRSHLGYSDPWVPGLMSVNQQTEEIFRQERPRVPLRGQVVQFLYRSDIETARGRIFSRNAAQRFHTFLSERGMQDPSLLSQPFEIPNVQREIPDADTLVYLGSFAAGLEEGVLGEFDAHDLALQIADAVRKQVRNARLEAPGTIPKPVEVRLFNDSQGRSLQAVLALLPERMDKREKWEAAIQGKLEGTRETEGIRVTPKSGRWLLQMKPVLAREFAENPTLVFHVRPAFPSAAGLEEGKQLRLADLGVRVVRESVDRLSLKADAPALLDEHGNPIDRIHLPLEHPVLLTTGRNPDNTLPVSSPAISRLHGAFVPDFEGVVEYIDLGSRNGTWVEGRKERLEPPRFFSLFNREGTRFRFFIFQRGNRYYIAGKELIDPVLPTKWVTYAGMPYLEIPFDEKGEATVGRDPENDIRILDPSSVTSRIHARLRLARDGKVRLLDAGSRRGTYDVQGKSQLTGGEQLLVYDPLEKDQIQAVVHAPYLQWAELQQKMREGMFLDDAKLAEIAQAVRRFDELLRQADNEVPFLLWTASTSGSQEDPDARYTRAMENYLSRFLERFLYRLHRFWDRSRPVSSSLTAFLASILLDPRNPPRLRYEAVAALSELPVPPEAKRTLPSFIVDQLEREKNQRAARLFLQALENLGGIQQVVRLLNEQKLEESLKRQAVEILGRHTGEVPQETLVDLLGRLAFDESKPVVLAVLDVLEKLGDPGTALLLQSYAFTLTEKSDPDIQRKAEALFHQLVQKVVNEKLAGSGQTQILPQPTPPPDAAGMEERQEPLFLEIGALEDGRPVAVRVSKAPGHWSGRVLLQGKQIGGFEGLVQGDAFDLFAIGVDKDYRGFGVGTLLTEWILQEAARQGFRRFTTTVTNPHLLRILHGTRRFLRGVTVNDRGVYPRRAIPLEEFYLQRDLDNDEKYPEAGPIVSWRVEGELASAAGLEEFSEGALETVVRDLAAGQNETAAMERIFGWIAQPLQQAVGPDFDRLAELRERVGGGVGWKALKDLPQVVDWIATYGSSDGTLYLQTFLQEARRLIDQLDSVTRAYQQAGIVFALLQSQGISPAQRPSLRQRLQEWVHLSDRYHAWMSGLIDDIVFIDTRLFSAELMGAKDIPALAEEYAEKLNPADPETLRFKEQVAQLKRLHQETQKLLDEEADSERFTERINRVEQVRQDAHGLYQQFAAGLEEALDEAAGKVAAAFEAVGPVFDRNVATDAALFVEPDAVVDLAERFPALRESLEGIARETGIQGLAQLVPTGLLPGANLSQRFKIYVRPEYRAEMEKKLSRVRGLIVFADSPEEADINLFIGDSSDKALRSRALRQAAFLQIKGHADAQRVTPELLINLQIRGMLKPGSYLLLDRFVGDFDEAVLIFA